MGWVPVVSFESAPGGGIDRRRATRGKHKKEAEGTLLRTEALLTVELSKTAVKENGSLPTGYFGRLVGKCIQRAIGRKEQPVVWTQEEFPVFKDRARLSLCGVDVQLELREELNVVQVWSSAGHFKQLEALQELLLCFAPRSPAKLTGVTSRLFLISPPDKQRRALVGRGGLWCNCRLCERQCRHSSPSHTQRGHAGKELVEVLRQGFLRQGLTSWLDIKMKDMSRPAMEEGVCRSRCGIAVLTDEGKEGEAYLDRQYCLDELRWAVAARVPVVMVVGTNDKGRIEDMLSKMPADLKERLQGNVPDVDRSHAKKLEVSIDIILQQTPFGSSHAPVS
eukprot:g3202.t1